MGLREEILGQVDLGHEDVVVPEWKTTVRLQEMTAEERIEFDEETRLEKEKLGDKAPSSVHVAVRLLLRTLRSPADGARLLETADFERLAKKSPRVLLRLFGIAARLNVLTDKEVEAAGKGSEATPPAAPPG